MSATMNPTTPPRSAPAMLACRSGPTELPTIAQVRAGLKPQQYAVIGLVMGSLAGLLMALHGQYLRKKLEVSDWDHLAI
jgi:hypothetical protein